MSSPGTAPRSRARARRSGPLPAELTRRADPLFLGSAACELCELPEYSSDRRFDDIHKTIGSGVAAGCPAGKSGTEFAEDSSLEGDGFEPSVPRHNKLFVAPVTNVPGRDDPLLVRQSWINQQRYAE